MKQKSLFRQSFSYLIIPLLMVVLLLSGIFFLSIRRSISVWNVNRGQRLENLILPLLTQVYRENGRWEEVAIHHTLSPFLTSNVFAYVFDRNQEPLYIYSQGGRVPLLEEDRVARSLARLEERSRPEVAILAAGEIVGYLAADTLGFSHDVANRRFLQSLFAFILWGAVLALFIALAAAYVFSRAFSREARELVAGLERLSRGERQVQFTPAKAAEMNAIARSAAQLQEQLHHEEDLRRQWADDVSHDLRTPVSALKLQLEGLADGVFSPTPERLTALYQEVGRVDSLVEDLRELNRVESPEMVLSREKIALRPFLENIFQSVADSFGFQGKPSLELSAEYCMADSHYLNRALINVLRNAFIHGCGGARLTISAFREGGFLIFEIGNPGWVDEERSERFFDRLYRGSSSRTEAGSGLGLSITRAIMRAHGGEASMVQRGDITVVRLTLRDWPEESG